MAPFEILIIGGGAAGIASAIAISKAFSTQLEITVFELRNQPGDIGGAVNLTPNALRCLDFLGVLDVLKTRKVGCEIKSIQVFSLHTGASLGTIDYNGDGNGFGGYRGRRVMRSELMKAMIDVALKMGIQIKYDKKLTALHETTQSVTVKFGDGTDATGDLVLGCDGIHSATRMQIEPARVPKYSGVSSAYGFVKSEEKMFFNDTALTMSRSGALLTTYCDDTRQQVYIAAMMESKGEISKEGWRAMGKDQEAIKDNIRKRFEKSVLPHMTHLVHNADEWFLFPVYILPPDGKWSTDRVILLGDSAHAMPPKGESIGYALEDAVIFSCVLSHFGLASPKAALLFYEKIRRKTINDAYKDSSFGWDTNKDTGFLVTKIMEWVTPLYLWWTKKSREASFATDPREIQFP